MKYTIRYQEGERTKWLKTQSINEHMETYCSAKSRKYADKYSLDEAKHIVGGMCQGGKYKNVEIVAIVDEKN